MAKPKLGLIPAAQGTKFYSVLPSNGTGDFDFTRGSTTNPDATRINAQGLIETVPNTSSRLNYPLLDGKVVGCPHHILEPQRTNLVTYSEDISNWVKGGFMSVVSNQIISPDGSLNADKLTSNSNGTSYAHVINTFAANNGVSSIFLKAGTVTQAMIYHGGSAKGLYVDLTNGNFLSFYSSGAGLTFSSEYYGNGWYRYSIIDTSTSTNALEVYLAKNEQITTSYTTNDYLYAWGGQYEQQGSFPTSYIKSNIGSATTRLAETASGAGNSTTFNDSEGVLMVEIAALANDSTFRRLCISDGTNNNRILFGFGDDNNISAVLLSGGLQANLNSSIDILNINKVAFLYKENNFELWINGLQVSDDTSGTTFSNNTLNVLDFKNSAGGFDFYGKAKQVQYFDTILDSQQLEELTSWDSFSDMANGQLYTIE